MNSISLRLLLGATLWICIGLLVAGLIVVHQVRTYSEALFDEDLKEEATALITASRVNKEGRLRLSAPLHSQRFYRPFSGWYWQIALNGKTAATSRSLWDERLDIDTKLKDPTGSVRRLTGPRGEELRARQVYSKVEAGDLYILVAGNTGGMQALRRGIVRFLIGLIPVLILLFLFFTYLQIRYGLRPLRALTQELREVRDGKSEKLDGDYPREIQPLADELNSLQTAHAELVERARRQVGNLAHAIKTPLSVLRNAARTPGDALPEKTHRQALLIQDQIDRHLSLARTAATSGRRGDLLDLSEIGGSIKKALEKIHAHKEMTIRISVGEDLKIRADKADMTEMLGNLMDNAAKWCKSRIELKAETADTGTGPRHIHISISDDGPGIPVNRRKEALERGKRLDERTPGTGLGLSIVSEMAELYGGHLRLHDSALGGLKARLVFPAGG